MLKFAYRCLTPNRCDAVAFALLLLYLTMLLMPLLWQCRVAIERWLPDVNDGRFLFMVPYLATWLAFTAVIGTWSKTTWRRQWKFALVGMFSYLALIGYSGFLGLLDGGIYANGTDSSDSLTPVSRHWRFTFSPSRAGRFQQLGVKDSWGYRIAVVGSVAITGVVLAIRSSIYF